MNVDHFCQALRRAGLSMYTGVPCSYFRDLIDFLDDHPEVDHYVCSSEGEAMGIAGGLALSGQIPVVYMQDDGYGNAVNPLSSLQLMYRLPALLLISWRGEPGKKDEPQHEVMGKTIQSLLTTFGIPCRILGGGLDELNEALSNSVSWFKDKKTPVAFLVPKGYFGLYDRICREAESRGGRRFDYIALLGNLAGRNDVILGATGFTGRELCQAVDHPGKFYMMGSMGCLASIGLGIAILNPDKTVYVLDGDGALLMKLGTLSTVGYHQPKNLIHICFDNNAYESTGGQKTTSNTTALASIAEDCGYRSALVVETLDQFRNALSNVSRDKMPCFLHVKVSQGTLEGLPRPAETPEKMKDSLMRHLL